MNIFESIILGIIQGLTEFLPISSSGHLVLAQHFLGFEMEGILFEITLHLGTLLSILIYYQKELKDICIKAINGDVEKKKYVFYLFISFIPIAFIGLFYSNFIESLFIPSIVILALFFNGLIIATTFFIRRKSVKKITFLIAVFIGVSQVFALMPGISRSGVTISTALLLGVMHNEAAKFSFLLAIPGLLGAGFFQIINIDISSNISLISLMIGFISAATTGYFVINFLLQLISKGKFYYFSFYCIFISIVSYLFLNIS